jgi:hypothetical protein
VGVVVVVGGGLIPDTGYWLLASCELRVQLQGPLPLPGHQYPVAGSTTPARY